MEVGKGFIRHRTFRTVLIEVFRLHGGHINPRRTFLSTPFTAHTMLHGFCQFWCSEPGYTLFGQYAPQHIGPTTRTVPFIARGHVRRAHQGSGMRESSAVARSVAFFYSA